MPGQLITTNTTLHEGETPYWKIDAYRLLPGDYTLEAQSRVPNIWAFIVTGLLGILAVLLRFRVKHGDKIAHF